MWGVPLIGLHHVMGGALTVVAPPLGSFGGFFGAFTWTSRVGGVIFRSGPVICANG